MKIYLAGGKGEWRDKVVDRFAMHFATDDKTWQLESGNIQFIDPFRTSRQGTLYLYTHDDLASVESADLIFTNIEHERHEGTSVEVGFAAAKGIPVVLTCSLPIIPPLTGSCAKYLFTDLDAAVDKTYHRFIKPWLEGKEERID